MYYAHTEAEHRSNARNYCKELCKILWWCQLWYNEKRILGEILAVSSGK
jgi:hypothetical protein